MKNTYVDLCDILLKLVKHFSINCVIKVKTPKNFKS